MSDQGGDEPEQTSGERRGLRIVNGAPAKGTFSGPVVPLIRQLKLPDLDRLTEDLKVAAALPGRVAATHQAIVKGDLKAADRTLDDALQPVLAGPGHPDQSHGSDRFLSRLRPKAGRPMVLGVILWFWFAALCGGAWYLVFSS